MLKEVQLDGIRWFHGFHGFSADSTDVDFKRTQIRLGEQVHAD
jgi:hypothetical protein